MTREGQWVLPAPPSHGTSQAQSALVPVTTWRKGTSEDPSSDAVQPTSSSDDVGLLLWNHLVLPCDPNIEVGSSQMIKDYDKSGRVECRRR